MREESSDDCIQRLRVESGKSRVRIAAQRAVHCQPQCKKSQSKPGAMPCRPRLRAALLSYRTAFVLPATEPAHRGFSRRSRRRPQRCDRARACARPPVRPCPLARGPGCIGASVGRRDGIQGRAPPGGAAAVARRRPAPGGAGARHAAVARRARTLARGRPAGPPAGRHPLARHERAHPRCGERARPGLGLRQLPVRRLQVGQASHGAGTSHRAACRRSWARRADSRVQRRWHAISSTRRRPT